MRLTKEELAMHNKKVLKIAELRCAKSEIPGLTVSYPDYMKGDNSKVQLAIPCGVIRNEKRKVNAMQVRTGAFTISLAKEKTKYDDELGDEFNDPTDYMPFDSSVGTEEGQFVTKATIEQKVKEVALKDVKVMRSRGILDL